MSDEIDLHRQVATTLQSLTAAGIEWLPRGEPIRVVQYPASNLPELPMPANSLTARRKSLELLATEIKTCKLCPELASTRTQTVFGDGVVGAELCFVGEAPGADEDAAGVPFVGRAGELLDKIIIACGFQRKDVYICNTIKCRPPQNRTPLPNEAANCSGYLKRQLEIIQPKFLCCLGGTAAKYLLGTDQAIGKLRGRFHEYQGIPVVVTYHPAYLLPHRNPAAKKDVWEDMKMLLAKMGRPVPEKKAE